MPESPAQLPPIPSRPGSSVIRTLWLVVLCWALYALLLSDFGILFSCWGEGLEEAYVGIKLHPVAALFAGKLLVDFILILRRRIAWWEWLVSLLIVSLAYFQLLILNVSPLD